MIVAELIEEQHAWIARQPVLDYYTMGEAGRLLCTTESQLYRLVRYKGLKAVRFKTGGARDQGQGRVRIEHGALVEWMAENKKARYAVLTDDVWLMIVPQKEQYVILDVARILGVTTSQVYSKMRYNTLAHIIVQPMGYRREFKAIEHDELVRYVNWAKSSDEGSPGGTVEVEAYDGF
jgi:hypothetical protein